MSYHNQPSLFASDEVVPRPYPGAEQGAPAQQGPVWPLSEVSKDVAALERLQASMTGARPAVRSRSAANYFQFKYQAANGARCFALYVGLIRYLDRHWRRLLELGLLRRDGAHWSLDEQFLERLLDRLEHAERARAERAEPELIEPELLEVD